MHLNRYNDRHLLAYKQNGHLHERGLWYATQYDDYGRSVAEGFYDGTPEDNGEIVQAEISKLLIHNKYGDSGIEIDKLIKQKAKLLGDNQGGYIHRNFEYDDCGRQDRLWGSTIKNFRDTSSAAYDLVTTYDDADQVLTTTEIMPLGQQPVTVVTSMIYDHAGRVTQERVGIDNMAAQQVFSKSYTVKDQINTLTLADNQQVVNYAYHPSRLLTKINDVDQMGSDLFAMDLGYNTELSGLSGTDTLSDGNISATRWCYLNANPQAYQFEYDFLKRLTEASYKESGRDHRYSSSYTYLDDRGNLDVITRQGMSDGTTGQIDNLKFNYYPGTNRLRTVADNGASNVKNGGYKSGGTDQYTYDTNGAMTHDPSRGADIQLNHLHLPQKVIVPDSGGATVNYVYDATGVLHSTTQTIGDTISSHFRNYIGSVEYYDGVLDQIHTSQGYIELTYDPFITQLHLDGDDAGGTESAVALSSEASIRDGAPVIYQGGQLICLDRGFEVLPGGDFLAEVINMPPSGFQTFSTLKDHLGNTRVVFTKINNSIETIDRHDFYPFGLEMSGSWQNDNENKYDYLYQGKEVQKELGLGYYDFQNRYFDPAIGRFLSVDKMADHPNQVDKSTYAGMWNNPISNTDPDGNCPMCIIPIIWAAAEVAMSAADAHDVYTTVTDPNATTGEKIFSVTTATAGVFLPGGGYSKIDDVAEGAVDVAKGMDKAKDASKAADEIKIDIDPSDQIDRSLLNKPDKPGNAPTFKEDGKKVEIHHVGQNPKGPFKEMHPTDHRGKGNYKKNHPNSNKPSRIDRKAFKKARESYWTKQLKNWGVKNIGG